MKTAFDDMYDKIDNATEVKNWIPKDPGDQVSGVVQSIRDKTNEFGDYKSILLIDRDGQLHNVNTFAGSLKKRIADLDPQVGDGLKITFEGLGDMKFNGKDTKFKQFTVALVPGPRRGGRASLAPVPSARPAPPPGIAAGPTADVVAEEPEGVDVVEVAPY